MLDELAPPRPRRRGVFGRRRRLPRPPPARDHRPLRRGPAAVRERGRRASSCSTTARSTTTVELRAELEAKGHRFRSADRHRGDARRATASGATRCVERFNGMWAFALWDAQRAARSSASRDRFGVKPFYYRLDGDRLSFASEPAVLRGDSAAAEPAARVRDYLEQGYLDHGDGDVLRRASARLPPAHSLVFGPERPARSSATGALEPHDAPADAGGGGARAVPRRGPAPAAQRRAGRNRASPAGSTRRRSPSRVAAPAAHERQKTVTAYFEDPGFDERPYARAVVEATGARAALGLVRRRTSSSRTSRRSCGRRASRSARRRSPRGWYVMREARRAGLKVMLDGQGGDELFARLPRLLRLPARRPARGRTGRARPAASSRPSVAARHGARSAPRSRSRGRIRAGARCARGARRACAARPRSSTPTFARAAPASRASNGSAFPDRLRRQLAARRSRAAGCRSSCATRTGTRWRTRSRRASRSSTTASSSSRSRSTARELIRRGETKSVLRRALADLLPPTVRERRDKLGFVTPEGALPARARSATLAAETFASRAFRERGLRRRRGGAAAARAAPGGRHWTAGMELWRALNLELWAQRVPDA